VRSNQSLQESEKPKGLRRTETIRKMEGNGRNLSLALKIRVRIRKWSGREAEGGAFFMNPEGGVGKKKFPEKKWMGNCKAFKTGTCGRQDIL